MSRPGKDRGSRPGSIGVTSAPTTSTAVRQQAFRNHVEPEIPLLLRVAQTLTGSWADSEDLVQDTLVRAYRAIDRFDGAHPPRVAPDDPAQHQHQLPPAAAPRPRARDQRPRGAAGSLRGRRGHQPGADGHRPGARRLRRVGTAGPRPPASYGAAARRRRPAHLRRDGRGARHPRGHRDVAAIPCP